MKRIIFSLLTLSAGLTLTFTSCAGEEPIASEPTTAVNFELSLPADYSTRALGDKETIYINKLNYTVFDSNNAVVASYSKEITLTDLSVDITVDLVPRQTYSIVFFASNSASNFSEFNNGVVTVNYAKAASNVETDDAFSVKISFTVGDEKNFSVDLNHTFAQLNFGTSDAATVSATDVFKSTLTIPEGLSTEINLLTNKVSKPATDVVLSASYITENNPGFPGNSDLQLVQMNYVLPSLAKTISTLTFTTFNGDEQLNAFTLTDVPVGLNFRTNVAGKLFTSTSSTSDIVAGIVK